MLLTAYLVRFQHHAMLSWLLWLYVDLTAPITSVTADDNSHEITSIICFAKETKYILEHFLQHRLGEIE